jgi:MtN3 and saliva related transmembrane protein
MVTVVQAIGWSSSLVLVLTIGRQVYKQWHDGTSRGVSDSLFVGQIAASLGFAVYSWLVADHVFVVTNVLMLFSAVVGCTIVRHHRRRDRDTADAHARALSRRRVRSAGKTSRGGSRHGPAPR